MDTSRLQSLFGLEGKRAVVTGGSRGIGAMIAEGLLDAGAEVIISARKETQVAEAVERLSAKGNIEGIPADLSTDEGLDHLAARSPSAGTDSTSSATTPVRRGANRSRTSRPQAGTRS